MSEKKKLSPEVQKIFDDDAERRKRFKVNPSPHYDEINEKDLPSKFDFLHHPVLEKIAYLIHKLLTLVLTLLTIAGVAVLYWIYKGYKIYQENGFNAAIKSEYIVYVIGYAILMFVVYRVSYSLYKFSQGY